MRVKMILPALTEATSPFWRPIKYSLFPPLGLATLAGYLDDDVEVEIQDEHVEPLDLDDAPDLVVIQVYITSARRAYALADHYRRTGRLCGARRSARDVAAATRQRRTPTPSSSALARTPGRGSCGLQTRECRSRVYQSTLRTLAGLPPHPPRSDQAAAVSRPQLDRRLARLPARVRLLLQGGVLRGRPLVLHADRRRCAGRDRTAARAASLLPRRPPVRRSPRSPPRFSTACAGWDGCGRPPAP